VYDVPSYIWVLVLIGVVGITGTTSLVLYRSAVAARLGSASSLSIAAASATLLGGFVLATGLLANAGVYHEDSGQAAPFFGAAFATVQVASLLLARVPLVRRILADPGTPARLALPHTFRFVGAVFLILMVKGDLPAAFAPACWSRRHRNSGRGSDHCSETGRSSRTHARTVVQLARNPRSRSGPWLSVPCSAAPVRGL
jgi:hypothetical protein